MRTDWWIWGLLLAMTLLGSSGSACFKAFSLNKQTRVLLLGFACYGSGALLNILLLRYLPYTVVLPANALTFVWTLAFARLLFHERVGMYQIAGVAFIFAGLLTLVWPNA